jgi:hypothetical protein
LNYLFYLALSYHQGIDNTRPQTSW